MGRDVDPKAEIDELEAQLKAKDMPEETREKYMAEMKSFGKRRHLRLVPGTITWTGFWPCPGMWCVMSKLI